MGDSRASFAGTDPGVPGAGPVPGALAAAQGLPSGKASRIHHGFGPRLAVTPARGQAHR